MFYRPEFCCSCGERIERVDWKPWTSRRFCDLCATKHQVAELAPRLIVGLGVFAGILGIGTYTQAPPGSIPPVTRRALAAKTNTRSVEPLPNFKTTEPGPNQSQPSSSVDSVNNTAPAPVGSNVKSDPVVKTEAAYYCGAETKKGTPCTRKVKGNVRCWQHRGMPAMLPPSKLLVLN